VADVQATNQAVIVTAFGPPPELDPSSLRQSLNDAGMSANDLLIRLVVGGSRSCPAGGSVCEAAPPV
jgi:hypothetical protein